MANSAKLLELQQIKKKCDKDDVDDRELQLELKNLVDQVLENDTKTLPKTLDTLKQLIESSITSVSSIPKPLKYLSPYYNCLKQQYSLINDNLLKQQLSDIISILSLGVLNDKDRIKNDCLRYCLQGTQNMLNNWGNEYIRQLECEIIEQWFDCKNSWKILLPLIKKIIKINFSNNDHIQTCDLLMEINQLELLNQYIIKDNNNMITLYLKNCSKFVDNYEFVKIQNFLYEIHVKFDQFCQALIVAIQMNDKTKVENLFVTCTDKCILYQMGFICARHLYQINPSIINDDILRNILDNNYLNQFFIEFGRDLDILEPKLPDDIYKINNHNDEYESAHKNLASSFVNGFINVGFGTDKLLTIDNSKWIYKNKDVGIMSTVASLGLLYLWDIDNGLIQIDKYLYSDNKFIKSGALLAIGIVNCRIKNECDPVLALLNDYLNDNDIDIMISAIFGIGLAYANTNRLDIIELLLKILQKFDDNLKIFTITSLMCGLISLGYKNQQLIDTIIKGIIKFNQLAELQKSPFLLLIILSVPLCYYGSKEVIGVIEFEEPLKTLFEIVLKMCSYACSGDVLIVQQLLKLIEQSSNDYNDDEVSLTKSLAILAIVIIVQDDEIGIEMIPRILTQISQYSNESILIRKTIPLAICLLSISNPKLDLITILLKYCHDHNNDVACNAIFSLGIIGAGTNNPRLSKILQQLTLYHQHKTNSYDLLFMIRFVYGLIYMGKGTVTLNPKHTNQQLIDPLCLIGILIPMFLLIKQSSTSFLLKKTHYFLYTLSLAIQPKWLFVINENLEQLHINVRIGHSVDIVGKVGIPKTITGTHQQITPILLNCNEKAELINENCDDDDDNNIINKTNDLILDGICVLKKKI